MFRLLMGLVLACLIVGITSAGPVGAPTKDIKGTLTIRFGEDGDSFWMFAPGKGSNGKADSGQLDWDKKTNIYTLPKKLINSVNVGDFNLTAGDVLMTSAQLDKGAPNSDLFRFTKDKKTITFFSDKANEEKGDVGGREMGLPVFDVGIPKFDEKTVVKIDEKKINLRPGVDAIGGVYELKDQGSVVIYKAVSDAPEPFSIVLLALGTAIVGLAAWGWRRRNQAIAAARHRPECNLTSEPV